MTLIMTMTITTTKTRMKKNAKITLRPTVDADEELLLRLYASTRATELAQVSWSQEQKDAFVRMQFAAQQQHYRVAYPSAEHEIICLSGNPVGRLYLASQQDAFHILDITVLPEERNAGVGSCVLQRIQDEARQAGRPVTIYVESVNPSLRLFERLGFQAVRTEGLHCLLQSS